MVDGTKSKEVVMARIKLSPLVEDIRGRIGNGVAAVWKGVHYVRSFAPVVGNPQNEKQAAQRNRIINFATKWWTLTEDQRALWEQYAQELGSAIRDEQQAGGKNIIPGYPRIVSGFNAYVLTNTRLAVVGLDPVDVPPLATNAPEAPVISDVTWDPATGTFTISYSHGPADYTDTVKLALFLKPPATTKGHAYIAAIADGITAAGTVTIDKVRVGGRNSWAEVSIKDSAIFGKYLFQFNGITSKGRLVPRSTVAIGFAVPGGGGG